LGATGARTDVSKVFTLAYGPRRHPFPGSVKCLFGNGIWPDCGLGLHAQRLAPRIGGMILFVANHAGGVQVEVSLSCIEEQWIGVNHIAFLAWSTDIAELIPVLSAQGGEFAIQRFQAGVAELLETWRILVVFVLVAGSSAVDGA